MGAAENVAIMQRAYDAFNTGDLDTLNEIFDGNAVWHLPGKSKYADDYQGADAILELLRPARTGDGRHVPGRAAAPDSR